MEKVKVIIIGRTFESKYFKNTAVERVTTSALEKEIFEKVTQARAQAMSAQGIVEKEREEKKLSNNFRKSFIYVDL